MKYRVRILSSLLLICGLIGCKPSEKNYRTAYDVAVAKQQSELPDASAGIGDAMREGGPTRKHVDGKTVWLLTEPLTKVEETGTPASWNVAVAAYKMTANAHSHAERLEREGYSSTLLKNSDGVFYVVVATPESMSEAAEFIDSFKAKHPDTVYVGLPEGPTVLSPGRRR